MNIPVQLIIFSLPILVYVMVQKVRGEGWGPIAERLGLRLPRPAEMLVGLGVAAAATGLAWLAGRAIPAEVFLQEGISQAQYAGIGRGVGTFLLALVQEALYVTLGEELLFRGLLGGWLVRRLGFAAGNLLQTLIFTLPHLLLLTVSLQTWPMVLVVPVGGWLFGWLRHRSGSIIPGWIAHTLGNALAALYMMG